MTFQTSASSLQIEPEKDCALGRAEGKSWCSFSERNGPQNKAVICEPVGVPRVTGQSQGHTQRWPSALGDSSCIHSDVRLQVSGL